MNITQTTSEKVTNLQVIKIITQKVTNLQGIKIMPFALVSGVFNFNFIF